MGPRDKIGMPLLEQCLAVIFFVIVLAVVVNFAHPHIKHTAAIDTKYFANIHDKCGVLATDEIYTTSLRKISDCLDRLDKKPVVYEKIYCNNEGCWPMPVEAKGDQCHAWCRQ